MDYILTLFSCVITVMFFLSGLTKLSKVNKVATGLENRFPIKNLPYWFFQISIVLVALLQILAPVAIVLSTTGYENKLINRKNARKIGVISCVALVVFTIFATLLYHFPPVDSHYYAFISNVTTSGALLLLGKTIYELKY